jgi:hypothetical protein
MKAISLEKRRLNANPKQVALKKQCKFPMEQNEVPKKQMKYLEKQLAHGWCLEYYVPQLVPP